MTGQAKVVETVSREPAAREPGAKGQGSRPAVIEARGLRKSYDGVKAVAGTDLEVRAGEVFAFLGPNSSPGHPRIRPVASRDNQIAQSGRNIRPSSPDFGVFAVAAAGVLYAFSCVVDALPEQCLCRRPGISPDGPATVQIMGSAPATASHDGPPGSTARRAMPSPPCHPFSCRRTPGQAGPGPQPPGLRPPQETPAWWWTHCRGHRPGGQVTYAPARLSAPAPSCN